MSPPLASEAARQLGCAILAGAAIALAGAPHELSFGALLSIAFLAGALEPRGSAVSSGRRAALLGLAMGVTTNIISMYWIVELLVVYGSIPRVIAILIGAVLWVGQALPFVLGASIAAYLGRTRALPLYAVLPASLTIATSWSPAVFPWHFGLSQLPYLEYAQCAELGGMPLLDMLVATVGAGLWAAFVHRDRRALIVALLAFALPGLYGAVRLAQIESERADAPALRVGIVQPNIGIRDKHDPTQHLEHLERLRTMTRELESRGAELVIWPESSYPFAVHRDMARDREGRLGLLRDGVRGPLLVGVLSTDGPVGGAAVVDRSGRQVGVYRVGTSRIYNSAIGIARDGRIVGIADKARLMPFSEHRPWEAWFEGLRGGLSPGRGPQAIRLAEHRIGVLNCYEDLMADHVRAQATFGVPDFWANVTNNAWFGDTAAPHLHHMNARMRAIETRRDLVRAVNTGVSGHTRASGRDAVRTGAFEDASFIAEVRVHRTITPWVRFGDWVSLMAAAWLLAAALTGRSRR